MASRYGSKPDKHRDVYDAIDPTHLAGTMEGKVVLITGAGESVEQTQTALVFDSFQAVE